MPDRVGPYKPAGPFSPGPKLHFPCVDADRTAAELNRAFAAGLDHHEEVVNQAVSEAERNITTQIANDLDKRADELEIEATTVGADGASFVTVQELQRAAKELRSQATRIRGSELQPIPDQVLVDVYDLGVILDAKGPWMADTDDFDVVKRLQAVLQVREGESS